MNLTESQLRDIIREELYVPNFLRAHPYPAYIFERSYVTDVLGLNIPLNESYPYTPSLERRIIQEQLLFEGFFSDLLQKGKDKLISAAEGVKKFGKEAWSILQGFYLAVKDGAAKQLSGSIAKKAINKFLKPIYAALKWLATKLPNWNMPTFASMAEKGLELLDKMKDKLNSIEGWKAVAMFSGVAVGLQWLWNKIGDWVDKLKEMVGGDFKAAMGLGENDGESEDASKIEEIKKWLKDTAKEALTGLIGGEFMKKVAALAATSTVAGWWTAAKKAGEGAKLVIDALGAATARFVSRHGHKLKAESKTMNETAKRKLPFRQKRKNGLLIREFSKEVDASELVWHRDLSDRHVTVRSGAGWQLQIENSLPKTLNLGETYFIPKYTYHRLLKGAGNLIVEIEENKMKITKSQLRQIVREAFGGHSSPPRGVGGISQALIDDYNSWVHKRKHITPAASSVMASYFVEHGMEDDHDAHEIMSSHFGLSHDDVMRDINLQIADQKAAEEILATRMGSYKGTVLPGGKRIGESAMKITKNQLRRIIKEAIGQGGLVATAEPVARMIVVDWDDDGAGMDSLVELHPDSVQDWNLIAATEGEEAANYAVTEMLTQETGYLVNGWEWA